MKPDTTELEIELVDKGMVFEGYVLRYLRQIRELLEKLANKQ